MTIRTFDRPIIITRDHSTPDSAGRQQLSAAEMAAAEAQANASYAKRVKKFWKETAPGKPLPRCAA